MQSGKGTFTFTDGDIYVGAFRGDMFHGEGTYTLLSAVALPAYTRYVQRGHRTEAMAALLEAQHYMERYYSANGQYLSPATAAPVLPQRLQQVPTQGSVRYRLSVREASVNSYLVQAVPEGSMAGDVCGSLTINQTGLRGVLNSSRSVAECWR
jgi:type IV pilus assembly protein PilE